MANDLVELFHKDPLETIFESSAEIEYIGRRIKENNTGRLVGETFTEQLQYNYIRPTFWERLQILFFGVPPYKILRQRPITEAELIISSLEYEPSKWTADGGYSIKHENGNAIWIASGLSCVRPYTNGSLGNSEHFNKDEKSAIWAAYLEWQSIIGAKNSLAWDKKVFDYAKARRSIV